MGSLQQIGQCTASEFMELQVVAEIDKQYVDHPGGGNGSPVVAVVAQQTRWATIFLTRNSKNLS